MAVGRFITVHHDHTHHTLCQSNSGSTTTFVVIVLSAEWLSEEQKRAITNESIYPDLIHELLTDGHWNYPNPTGIDSKLSPNLRKVLDLKATGFTDEEIAQEMTIELDTVKRYLGRIRQRLGVSIPEAIQPLQQHKH